MMWFRLSPCGGKEMLKMWKSIASKKIKKLLRFKVGWFAGHFDNRNYSDSSSSRRHIKPRHVFNICWTWKSERLTSRIATYIIFVCVWGGCSNVWVIFWVLSVPVDEGNESWVLFNITTEGWCWLLTCTIQSIGSGWGTSAIFIQPYSADLCHYMSLWHNMLHRLLGEKTAICYQSNAILSPPQSSLLAWQSKSSN